MVVKVWLTVTVTVLVAVRLPPSFTVTIHVYAPALVKVAVVVLAALVPFGLKVTAAGGLPVVAQVYTRAGSPPLSVAVTESAEVVAVTADGVAAAETVMPGA
jgi:hypothetical protein